MEPNELQKILDNANDLVEKIDKLHRALAELSQKDQAMIPFAFLAKDIFDKSYSWRGQLVMMHHDIHKNLKEPVGSFFQIESSI